MDVLRASSIHRSRGGCWTCKRRHKKCGEERPVCQRCTKAGMACEGYDVRLNWAMSSAAASTTGAGSASPLLVDAQAQSRRQKKARRRKSGTGGHDDDATASTWSAAPDQLDLLCLQSWPAGQPGIESPPGEDVSRGLMDEFIASGHQTLTGRSGKETLFMSDVLPLCEECMPLRHACIAYQASLRTDTSRWAPVYMQSALSRYVEDLNLPEKMSVNSTLATGVLLCSVSINSLYVWTPLLTGLHGVLLQRGLLAAPRDDPLACHLLEVVSLMDMPCFTINRLSPSLNLWKLYVAPSAPSGIEQTSGLPYSLLTLLADVGSPRAEEALLRWPGELGEDFIQIHLWDAFRYAGVLHNRALCPTAMTEAAGVTSTSDSPVSADILRMRALASVQAIIDSGAFTFRQPLARAILYPLFIAGLLADASMERQVCRVALQHIINIGQQGPETVVADILTRIWTEGNGTDHAARLEMCVRFVAELNAEIHLY